MRLVLPAPAPRVAQIDLIVARSDPVGLGPPTTNGRSKDKCPNTTISKENYWQVAA